MTKSQNVVSLQRCLMINKTTTKQIKISNNNNKTKRKMETNERNIETTYLTAVNWLNNSRILCNEICNIDELFWDNCRFELEKSDEIFQFFLTNCTEGDVEFLEKHFGLLFAYSQLLDLYVLCVDHYGTNWDCVTCYTDIEMAKK